MDMNTILILIGVIVATGNFAFALLRTYYAKKTYLGSVEYWTSWEKRKYDVAAQVLKEMGVDSPDDMRKLIQVIKKKKKRIKKVKK